MERSPSPEGRWGDLPEDIAIAVASRLQEADVCALGGCSRSWRSACDADFVWEGLFRRRWPVTAATVVAGGRAGASSVQGWKALYINHHGRTAVAISRVIEFVESSTHNGSLEAEYYLKAIADLALMKDIGFVNVQFFLLSRNRSAIINLIGLHYSIACLHILMHFFFQPNEVDKALQASQIAERKVCVSLLKLGRWFYGFRLPDDYESTKISLSGLTSAEGAKVLVILNRGAVHEVFRLQRIKY
ncbi:uncharacterized protein LOC100824382 isoform X2 [Brachypodium distachyon]|uniref:uncharacterized protein LOC100824382 isoform X2 n=1 Tax=Brachypodium distachyon TaxID=15368 RepID=UPI000D0E3061|nr:uncharacterized protein LOC100824382 isoform X2 [Brachypodium distachyon]|eukprot:XP_024314995.1 uncharacterized protein LOC100824382 isoform X2 [Brachypodium distachyon]